MNMTINGLTFRLAIVFRKTRENEVYYEVVGNGWDRCPGVYAVYENDSLVYVGKFQNGVLKRWVYKKGDIYHFKKNKVEESVRNGNVVRVFAEHESKLKEQINSSKPEWINASGIESHLVGRCDLNLPWNKNGKNHTIDD